MEEMHKRYIALFIISLFLSLSFLIIYADAEDAAPIGKFRTAEGSVDVTHKGETKAKPVRVLDDAFFLDIVETLEQAKTKIFFIDDSILNIGEKTRIEITEHIFDPNNDRRSLIVKLVDGKVRALVGRYFSGSGSKFEIHTPTAVAAARGSYGIVWVQEVDGKIQTGVINLGGLWEVRNVDPNIPSSIILKEGEFTQVQKGLPPMPGVEAKPDLIKGLQAATDVKERPKEELPKGSLLPGREIATEKPPPISTIIQTAQSTTTKGSQGTITSELTIPVIPPIQQQPPPITTPVHVEIRFK